MEFYFKLGTHKTLKGFSVIIHCTRNLPGNPFKHTGTEIPMGLFNAFGVLVDQNTHKQKSQRSDVESICMRDIPGTPFELAMSYPAV